MATKQDLQIHNVIIGTAGHIDHGKSSIIKRLTGVDPDRLPAEKERGMTIDLGFAPYQLKDGRTVGIIDVPGHERFIKNMVAGATSIDFVMMVVAADDGIMPQTREHLSIMKLLGVKRGMILVNKIDLVDPDMKDLVIEEIRDLVKGSFLDGAPALGISATTGEGIEALVDQINKMVAETPPHNIEGAFRMPIQRIFSAKGFGTIVTGVPITGTAKIGETLEILPLGKQGRVRKLNAYKTEVDVVRAGHSSAINISDVDHNEVHRGMVAATPGLFAASNFVEARFRYTPDYTKPLRNRMPVKLHVGTTEADGRIVLLDKKQLEAGEEALVQFRLEDSVVVADGDPFIVRLQSPLYTIGGGQVLDSSQGKLRRFRDEIEQRLTEKEQALADEDAALEFYIKDCGARLIKEGDVAAAALKPLDLIREALRKIVESDKVVQASGGKFVHQDTLAAAVGLARQRLHEFHEANPLRAGMDLLQLKRITSFPDDFFALVREHLVAQKLAVVDKDKIRRTDFQIKMSREDAAAAGEIEGVLRETKFSTPRMEEIAQQFSRFGKERLDRVIKLLADQGRIARLKDGVLMHAEMIEAAKEIVEKVVAEHGAIEAAQFRDLAGTTRKYVIPLLEHLDEIGFTQRQGNTRTLRKKK